MFFNYQLAWDLHNTRGLQVQCSNEVTVSFQCHLWLQNTLQSHSHALQLHNMCKLCFFAYIRRQDVAWMWFPSYSCARDKCKRLSCVLRPLLFLVFHCLIFFHPHLLQNFCVSVKNGSIQAYQTGEGNVLPLTTKLRLRLKFKFSFMYVPLNI